MSDSIRERYDKGLKLAREAQIDAQRHCTTTKAHVGSFIAQFGRAMTGMICMMHGDFSRTVWVVDSVQCDGEPFMELVGYHDPKLKIKIKGDSFVVWLNW